MNEMSYNQSDALEYAMKNIDTSKKIERLEKENQLLKAKVEKYDKIKSYDDVNAMCDVIMRLEQENEELKNQIEECLPKDILFLYNSEHQRRMELQLKLKCLLEENQELKTKLNDAYNNGRVDECYENIETRDALNEEIFKLQKENQTLKHFAIYCIKQIHNWNVKTNYSNQNLINDISTYINDKGIKELLQNEIKVVDDNG